MGHDPATEAMVSFERRCVADSKTVSGSRNPRGSRGRRCAFPQQQSAFGQFLKVALISKRTCLPRRIPGRFTREDERPHSPVMLKMRQSTTQAAKEAGCLRRAEEVTVY